MIPKGSYISHRYKANEEKKGNVSPEHIVEVKHGFKPNLKAQDRQAEKKKLKLLNCYYEEMTITHALSRVGVDFPTFEVWRENDKSFSKAFAVCWNAITDRLKRIGIKRGLNGSDNLLMFVLKQQDPSFRDKMLTEMDPKIVENIVNTLVLALRKNIPDSCPHCKNNLHLSQKVARMLSSLTMGMER